MSGATTKPAAVLPEARPQGWPAKCGRCGADWTHIGFDYADGFNCRACGGCDSDEGPPEQPP